VKGKTVKILEENIEYLHDVWVGKDFLNMPQKALDIKEKIDNLDFIKIKSSVY
jgi:hypothetical protein